MPHFNSNKKIIYSKLASDTVVAQIDNLQFPNSRHHYRHHDLF